MRVVMFGYQTWGHRTLQALLDSEHDVVLVVTHPKSEHVYEKIWSDSVADLAEEHGVPVLLRNRPDDEELFERLKAADPDVIVANNWRTWIPPRVFGLPRHGTLNVHDSLLPKYAGFSPLIWALINGETEVGVTAHMMNDELDAGDIVRQEAVPVGPADTATDLFHKTVDLIAPVTIGALGLIASGQRSSPARTARGRASSTSAPSRTAASTGPGPPRPSNAWSAPSPTRTPAPSPSTGAGASRSSPPGSPAPATAARPAGSSTARATAW